MGGTRLAFEWFEAPSGRRACKEDGVGFEVHQSGVSKGLEKVKGGSGESLVEEVRHSFPCLGAAGEKHRS